jgi:hypothetical protein
MPAFTIRVELHNASYSDYETLHAAMARRGFSRQITSDDGVTYQLPTAEYERSGNLTTQQVLDAAKAAAAETGKTFAVLVTEATRRMWIGLAQGQSRATVPSFR